MSPRHHFKQVSSPYFASQHYKETHEAKLEAAIASRMEFFCNRLKYMFVKKGKKNGQD